MNGWHIATSAGVGVAIVCLAVLIAWWIARPNDHGSWADVIRSAVLAVGAMGAVPAGYVAYRKQRTTEATHQLAESEHKLAEDKEQKRVSELSESEQQRRAELTEASARTDAKEYRDRYTAAAAQLGHDKAPIRLAGVYAMAQLADEWGRTEPEQRQTCIDVLCSYLRMPWPAEVPENATDQEKVDKQRLRDEETRVRETILRVIASHLHVNRDPSAGWHSNNFDLTAARLTEVRMPLIKVAGNFVATGATFLGEVQFDQAIFAGDAWFNQATFSSEAENVWFTKASFGQVARFDMAVFNTSVWFDQASFAEDAWFDRAMFYADAGFAQASFAGAARFDTASIRGRLVRIDGSDESSLPDLLLRSVHPMGPPII